MTTPISITSSTTDSQMHNNIMAARPRDRPPMLATRRYPQWQSRFVRYIDTRPNGDALSKCILEGPYQPTTVTILAVPITENSPAVPERTTSIPSEDPYKEAARQLLEQAQRSLEYVPDPMELEDHVPVYIPEPEHPEDLVPAKDEAPIEAYITKDASAPTPPLPLPFFLPTLIRPPHTRAAMAQRRVAAPSTYHSLLLAGTPPLLPIPLPAPSTSRRADILEAGTPPRKRLLLTSPTPRVGFDHSFVDTVDTRVQDTKRRTMAAVEEAQEDRAAVRAEIEILRRERLAYEQESIETRQALARSEAYRRAQEARIRVLETQAYRHEWQCQDANNRAIEHIICTQALEAGARTDTLEDIGSSA
ncbi:hypothetical protein Tco_0328778 [Tanacetum coccineum]